MNTFNDLREAVNRGNYNTRKPYPSSGVSKGVERNTMLKEYREDSQRLQKEFEQSLKSVVETELGGKLTVTQWEEMFRYVWGEFHGSGYGDVIGGMQDLMDVIKTFLLGPDPSVKR